MTESVNAVQGCLNLYDYLDMLPFELKNFIISGKNLVTDDPKKLQAVKADAGLHRADSLTVLHFDTETCRLNHSEIYVGSCENLLHEAGHVLDAMFGDIRGLSGQTSFCLIFKQEAGKSGFSDYLVKDSYEYFAESFSDYCLELAFGSHPDGKESMKLRCPETWKYIHKAVTRLQSQGYDPKRGLT